MKLTTTFLLLAVLGSTAVLSAGLPSALEGLKEDCKQGETPPDTHTETPPPDTTTDTPPPDTTTNVPPTSTTDAACSSSVIAELIGVDLLNCANINILTAKRDLFPKVQGHDPVLEEMKRRNGFSPRGICESSAAAKLIAGGILNCADVNILTASDQPLDADTCSSSEVGLLGAAGILNCANVNVLSAKRGHHQDKHVHLAAKREQSHKALIERVLNVRDCATQTDAKLISADALDCAVANVLTNNPAVDADCATSTAAQLISLSALNCAKVNGGTAS